MESKRLTFLANQLSATGCGEIRMKRGGKLADCNVPGPQRMSMKGEPSQIIDIGAEQGRRRGRLDWRDKDVEGARRESSNLFRGYIEWSLDEELMNLKTKHTLNQLRACPTDKKVEAMWAPGGARTTLSEDEDEVVPPKPKKSHPPRAAVIDESVRRRRRTCSYPSVPRRSASRAFSIRSFSSGAGNVPDTDYDVHPNGSLYRIMTKRECCTAATTTEKTHKEKLARERKADKETIKFNVSVDETTYRNHLATIAKTRAGAKNMTSILMHNIFKNVMQLQTGAGVPSTGDTHINIVEAPYSD
ncbi:hypothetical protein B0H14DRAFT_2619650 [Mycena olivaceomarginata]|nr:hypothetical protein B0H14DRAFT_2619650 [Mycena olivaceomarginata]